MILSNVTFGGCQVPSQFSTEAVLVKKSAPKNGMIQNRAMPCFGGPPRHEQALMLPSL